MRANSVVSNPSGRNLVAVKQPPLFLNTDELALLLRMRPQSVRQALCDKGHVNGLRPVKMPNRRLLWSSVEVFALIESLSGGATK